MYMLRGSLERALIYFLRDEKHVLVSLHALVVGYAFAHLLNFFPHHLSENSTIRALGFRVFNFLLPYNNFSFFFRKSCRHPTMMLNFNFGRRYRLQDTKELDTMVTCNNFFHII